MNSASPRKTRRLSRLSTPPIGCACVLAICVAVFLSHSTQTSVQERGRMPEVTGVQKWASPSLDEATWDTMVHSSHNTASRCMAWPAVAQVTTRVLHNRDACRTVHLLAAPGDDLDKLERSYVAFANHGFHAVVWCSGNDQCNELRQARPTSEGSSSLSIEFVNVQPMLDAFPCHRGGQSELLLPLRLLAHHGGWYFNWRFAAVFDVDDFIAQTGQSEFVMSYNHSTRSLSLNVFYCRSHAQCKAVLDVAIHNVLVEDRTAVGALEVALSEQQLWEHVLPVHTLLRDAESSRALTANVATAVEPRRLATRKGGIPQCAARKWYKPRNATDAHFVWSSQEDISPQLRCSLSTFVQHGFRVFLWTNQRQLTIPTGVSLRMISGELHQALTEDWEMGYRVLSRFGGWLFEMGTLCLRPAKAFASMATAHSVVVGYRSSRELSSTALYFSESRFPALLDQAGITMDNVLDFTARRGHVGTWLMKSLRNMAVQAKPEFMFDPFPRIPDAEILTTAAQRSKAEVATRHSFIAHWPQNSQGTIDSASFLGEVISSCSA